jgi:lipopolysaccharide/colanic/teichoic acid biosynthesis glycosyltransferase
VGRWLRRTSLDELPQLINVVLGTMSIVGVRPVEPQQLASWPDENQDLYKTLRPGMTGLWQVEGRSTVRSHDRLALDRSYLENWSVWADVKIAARTPFALLRIHHAH